VTGTFTVQNAVFGPNGYVQTLDATFEQHCEGAWPGPRPRCRPAAPRPTRRGKAEVQTTGSAVDPTYGNTVTVNKTTVVTLKSVPLPS
jgi:hypothetical protein